MLLSVLCGSGAQVLSTCFFTILFSSMGYMNPSRRGHLLMGGLMFFVLMGGVNGYTTARLYKCFDGEYPQSVTKLTALALPGLAFGVFFLINIVAFAYGSTNAVPLQTWIALVIMWLGWTTPLVFVGARYGYMQDKISCPVMISSISRQIPDQPWFMGIPLTLAIGGILPFGSCFVELYYIMSAVWMEFYYYAFGFLLLVFFILLITCAGCTMLFSYHQLRRDDYHCWWSSFCFGGSTSIYVFLYSIVYFKQLYAHSLSTYVLYFGYMALCSTSLFCMMGFVGLMSALWFNRFIYSSIKVE
jgi:transmembrane 9 superfamily member 2/4